ncbi:MAG: hypothetical protein HY754_10120 [Nitrospirae bacterium]|nr:hypothetical protein [Nitrospirota bacterium]
MKTGALAEAIILQSIEDLWHESLREDCVKFFRGNGFTICAGLAGMNLSDREKLLRMIDGLIKNDIKKSCRQVGTRENENTHPLIPS